MALAKNTRKESLGKNLDSRMMKAEAVAYAYVYRR